MPGYSNYRRGPITLNDALALDRTRLANERTLLAYIRAALMMGVSSITIFKLLPDETTLNIVAWIMLPASIMLALIGIVRSFRVASELSKLEQIEQASNET